MQYEIGHYYHAFNRGNNRQRIFYEPENYKYLLRLIRKNMERYKVTIIAYCLMPNHYHLLIRQDSEIPLSKFIQSTFQSYVQAFNNRYHRSGKLFENPREPIEVDDEEYLFSVCRYIHRNPIKAELVEKLVKWQYSNYAEFIGVRNGTLFTKDLFKEWFLSRETYQEFVEESDDAIDEIQ